MIAHAFDVILATPDGLFGDLEAHELQRSIEVEAERVDKTYTTCQVDGCRTFITYLLKIHRAHSRRASEDVGLCFEDLGRHRTGERLRIRVESNR
jgi:hypothetical protein